MSKIFTAIMGLSALLFAGNALAQDDEEPKAYTYASYHYCDISKEGAADKAMERYAPVLDKLVDDGAINSWGWMSHHTGGQWRRIRWHQSDSVIGALEALGTMQDALQEAFGEDDTGNAEFSAACPRHDDYLWQVVDGKWGDERGKVGFSVYFMCDISREGRADEIMAELGKPFLDKMVDDDKLESWGWQTHIIGGKVRKLQTMTAKDLPTLLAARAEAIESMYPDDSAMGQEFADICGSHVDYIWNNELGK